MDFGEKGLLKKQGTVTSKAVRHRGKFKILALKIFLFVVVVGLISVGVYVFGLVKNVVDNAPKLDAQGVKPEAYPSHIVDNNGTELQEFTGEGANRVYVGIKDITKDTRNAFVSIEDNRFYEHSGVDLQGITRAFFVGIKNGGDFTEGASTITQQLLKNSYFSNFTKEKTFSDRLERKIQEIYLAVKLEKVLKKEQILEYYLNTINLGQNCLGIQTASQRYFNKDSKDLTLSESAVIAGITKNPTRYNPITNPEENNKRRKKVLSDMVKYNYITKDQMNKALADNVYERIQEVNLQYENSTDSTNSYFVDALAEQVINDLQEQLGYSKTQASNKLNSGGLTITACQDLNIQHIIDEEVNNDANYPTNIQIYLEEYSLTVTLADGTVQSHNKGELLEFLQDGYGPDFNLLYSSEDGVQADLDSFKEALEIPEDANVVENKRVSLQPQTSVVIMDQATGEVKGISGGRGEKTVSFAFNRATDSCRQPGSCYKVLSTYAPAVDLGDYTLNTPILDEPYNYEDGTPVKNWYSGYWGTVTLRKAIEQSMNICAVKTLTDITPKVGYNYLLNFGFTTLVDDYEVDGKIYTDIKQPLALGGITNGVTNKEMTAAYAALANGGKYIKPTFYTKIVDHDGKVLIDKTTHSRQVVKDSTAYLITDAMKDVVTKGTGMAASLGEMPVSGKTGTSTDNNNADKDIWFCAYTPYYTCGVWGGYDNNNPLSNSSWHLKLWKAIMERAHEGLEVKDFTKPDSVQTMSVCSDTGMKAKSGCPYTTGMFAVNEKTKTECTKHKGYAIGDTTSNNNGYNYNGNYNNSYGSWDQ